MKKLLLTLLVLSQYVHSQSIISWTEHNGTLGLGYPVPIPVDTPEPFDGFRTYNGLLAKHQSLALENDYITGQVVGQTRQNRDIWAYILSDEDNLTKYGVKEGAMLINGNIHAREWQTPEVLTGIMELLHANSSDNSLHQYLLENTTIVAVPVNNVDGLLQTQRYPTQNWYSNTIGPRDGRMRRKNMFNVDEILNTSNDYLRGVDLNRNNNPYWATSNRSSSDQNSIVHHGLSAQSEPETQARIAAANLVDADQLRIYTDVHSFTQVHFSVRTNNSNRTTLMRNLLLDFSRHHAAFPANVFYQDSPSGPGGGIGSTDEYYAEVYDIPSWTLEVEPRNGGVDYGGFGNNGHDGFILPESEITRVREQLAQTFMVAWYGQSGPPSITQFRVVDKVTDILVYDSSWDIQPNGSRELFVNKVDNLIAGKDYQLIVSFDKPMRMRNNQNQIVALQGQFEFVIDPTIIASKNGQTLDVVFSNSTWINHKSNAIASYKFYQDDTYSIDFTLPEDLTIDANELVWSISTTDMVGQKLDANPASVVTWANGQWQNYEDTSGQSSIFGGVDAHYSMLVSKSSQHALRPRIKPTGLFYDPTRSGEGFSYELLTDSRVWIQWYTYDNQGNQQWYSGLGQYNANSIVVNKLTKGHGGKFGEQFDASLIQYSDFGSLEFVFSGGTGDGFDNSSITAKALFTDVYGKKLRTNFVGLSQVRGAINDEQLAVLGSPVLFIDSTMSLSGSWYDPARSGEGYVLEFLTNNKAVVVWFTYDLEGNLMWLIDTEGEITVEDSKVHIDFNNVLITNGGLFGDAFNPDDVTLSTWGELHFDLVCEGEENSVSYASTIEGFGSGEYALTQITHPLVYGSVCNSK